MIRNHRHHDPPTSASAGRQVEADGSAQYHRLICLDAVTNQPGLTARELEQRLGIKAHKRLPELRRAGLVRNGRPRHCTVTGRLVMTWRPVEAQPSLGALA